MTSDEVLSSKSCLRTVVDLISVLVVGISAGSSVSGGGVMVLVPISVALGVCGGISSGTAGCDGPSPEELVPISGTTATSVGLPEVGICSAY